ncbi:MAG: hypothetical protein HKK66_09825 [Chlorobiaceae bacterium]|nr:hypothetical protein [Chlorobiaceae bacterium]
MPLLPRRKKFILNWLKAFMLSPGVLFPTGYLLLYLSTNIYLNVIFKTNLSESVERATGNTWQTSIKSIKSGLVFDCVTLKHIELTKTARPEISANVRSRTLTIDTLEIPFPNVQMLLFSSTERQSSTNALCEKILAEQHLDQ